MKTLKSLADLKEHPHAVQAQLDKVDDRPKREQLERRKRKKPAEHARLPMSEIGLKAFRDAAVKDLSKGQLRRIEKHACSMLKTGAAA